MDGEPPQEEDFSQIPLVDRSQHKNWKARLSAYNDVIAKSSKTASDTDPFFRPFVSDGSLLKKWCLDANAVAQEKGIEAVLSIVQHSGESSSRTRMDVAPALVEKALGNARAGTKKKGCDLCAMYVEVENGGEGVLTDVLVGLDSKQPKVVAGSISCLKDIVESFGVPAMGNIKPLLKSLSKIFAHSDKNVRAEGTALALTLYTYLGAALLAALGDLKPLQMTELQKAFDGLDAEKKGAGTGKPTRWTRKVQREREAAEAAGGGGDGEAAEEEEAAPIDPKSLLDPIDALSLFPGDLMDRLASTKWKDRLESLEECNKVLAMPQNARIADNNVDSYGPLTQTLGTKCKGDANVNVVIEAAKLLESLAKGMGKPWARHRASIMPGCLERLKERKATVVDAVGKALDALFECTTLSDVVEDVILSLKSKNPQVKEGTLKFLHRSLQTTTTAPGKDQVKPMAETLVTLLGDSVEPVRTNAAECLGTLMKILGERAFNPYIEGVGELQMTKVKDAFAKAEIRYKAGGGKVNPGGAKPPAAAVKKAVPSKPASAPAPKASAAPASPPIKATGKYDMDLLDEFAPPAKAPPARFQRPGAPKPPSAAPSSAPPSPPKPAVAKKTAPPPPAAAGPSKSSAVKASGSSKTLATSPSEPVKYRYTPEDAAAKASEVIPAEYHTKLADAAWKTRLEAAEEMVKWVEEGGGAEAVDSEVMMRFLGKTPGWGEKNFQVSGKLYQVMTLMAEKSPSFSKAAAALVIGPLCDKLGDLKLKKPSGDAMTAFAEKTSLAFVLAQAYEPMQKQKAPKAQADALTWIKQQITEFGIAGIPLRDLISFVKSALGSPNAAVRSSATSVLVTVRIFVGADISGFLEDLNPQLLNTINSECEKVAGQVAPEPTRTQADLKEAAPSGKGGAKSGGGGDPLDDLIPRVDLDKLVGQTSVLADSRNDAWKVRKEAFEALNALLEVKSNSRLKANMGEIGSVLKKAMADTNLSVKMLALGIISKIATGMGQPFDKHARLLTSAVASVCADQKAGTRTAALATLSTMADATGGLDAMYAGIATSIESVNPALRASVLGWLAERLQAEAPSPSSELSPLAGPILSCLEDRNGDVRKGAGAVLPFVVASAGFEFVMDQTSNLKPASRATIVPLIEKARASAAPAPTKAAPPSAPAGVAKVKAPPPGRSSTPSSPAPAAPPARTLAAPARSMAMKSLGTAPAIRAPAATTQEERTIGLPKPRVGLGLTRRTAILPTNGPPTSTSSTFSSSSSSKQTPFITSTPEPRLARLKKDSVRWILDTSPKTDLTEYLSAQMEPHTSPELLSQLFSKDHRAEEDFMAGLTVISDFYALDAPAVYGITEEEVRALQLGNTDLALKYSALKLMGNTTQLANRCLEVVGNVVDCLMRYNERFSDGEARLFVPALIMKLGDSKFGSKLSPILESLDKVIAGSQVVQLFVQYGLEDKSAGKTCKNESLALIERAYRKRGSILRTKDDRAFYEAVARCIADSGTRSAALSVMALLQMQGGSSGLQAIIDGMSSSAKDMLANRKATMVTAKSGVPASITARASSDSIAETAGTPAKIRRPLGTATPTSRLPAGDSPAPRTLPRNVASPVSRLPKSSSDTPSRPRSIAGPSALPRPSSTSIPSGLQRPNDPFAGAGRPSKQPLATKGAAMRPLSNGHRSSHGSDGQDDNNISKLINDIRNDDIERSINALKAIQPILEDDPDAVKNNVQTLVDTVLDKLDQAFSPTENLNDTTYFRYIKHLIQTISGVTTSSDLMHRLNYDDIYSILYNLSLRLVQSDRLGTVPPGLTQFINMIVISVLATPDRHIVFRAMFQILINLTRDWTPSWPIHDSEMFGHADLVMKCLWKRGKLLEDDFRSGRMMPGKLLGILEEFIRVVRPEGYRKRALEGVELGDMPLRTVKSTIQRIVVYTKETDQEIYQILLDEFGDAASDTIVYTYIFRLSGAEPSRPVKAKSNGVISRPPSVAAKSTFSDEQEREEMKSQQSTPPSETEAQKLVRQLLKGDQTERLDAVHAFLTANPDREGEIQAAISQQMTAPVQMYVRRALETRKTGDNPSPSRPEARSPVRPESLPASKAGAGPRRSLAPRPSSLAVPVDKSAPINDQLAQLKNIFQRSSEVLGASQNTERSNGAVEREREREREPVRAKSTAVLAEIHAPLNRVVSSRSDDVD